MALFSRKQKGPAVPGRKEFDKAAPRTKAIVFYAENGDSWPHFEPIVESLRGRGHELSYLTSSPDDPVLQRDDAGMHTYEIGEGMGRSFCFQTMEAGAVVATLPQLGTSLLPLSKRASAVGMRYVHVFHSMVSTHMIYEPDAYDHYDAVLCVGPFMIDEIRKREALANVPAKDLVPHGYGRLDRIIADPHNDAPRGASTASGGPCVLLAPSWGPTCIVETCGVEVVQALLDGGCEVIARPHPMTKKRSPQAYDKLATAFRGNERFTFDTDIASRESLRRADVMVSDWSGAALEFAFGLERPVVYIDVPRKVNNPEYERFGIEPIEASVRERLGALVAPDALASLPQAVRDLCGRREAMRAQLVAVRDECIYNVGTSGDAAADYIVAQAQPFLQKIGGAS